MALAVDEMSADDCVKDRKTTSPKRYIDVGHGVYCAYLTHN